MSVIGYNRNEMATLNLVKTCCVRILLCICEMWYLDYNDYHRLNVVWNNNPFAKCLVVAGVKVCHACLLFYCQTLPLSYMSYMSKFKILFCSGKKR